MKGRVLVIAGSDSSGGAGIQADIKTITTLGGYAATAITAITVQDTKNVYRVSEIPSEIVAEQIKVVLADIGADAIKIGMIGSVETARSIVDALSSVMGSVPIVLDPVLVATSGDALAAERLPEFLSEHLIPCCKMVTPNSIEATVLTGIKIKSRDDQIAAGKFLVNTGAKSALIKGGHLGGDVVTDVLVMKNGQHFIENPRIETTSTHGTGCTLSSAIAIGLAQGLDKQRAVERAVKYVRGAIKTAPGYGGGRGPLNHGFR